MRVCIGRSSSRITRGYPYGTCVARVRAQSRSSGRWLPPPSVQTASVQTASIQTARRPGCARRKRRLRAGAVAAWREGGSQVYITCSPRRPRCGPRTRAASGRGRSESAYHTACVGYGWLQDAVPVLVVRTAAPSATRQHRCSVGWGIYYTFILYILSCLDRQIAAGQTGLVG